MCSSDLWRMRIRRGQGTKGFRGRLRGRRGLGSNGIRGVTRGHETEREAVLGVLWQTGAVLGVRGRGYLGAVTVLLAFLAGAFF